MRYNPKKQMQAILSVLSVENKTVVELAETLAISTAVVRRRLSTLKKREKIRVSSWIISRKAFIPVYGEGKADDTPKPVIVKVKPRTRLVTEVRGCKPVQAPEGFQYQVVGKLKELLGCSNYSIMADMIGCDTGLVSRVRYGKERLSPLLFLRVATVLDMSPKALAKKVGLPEYFFLEKRRAGHD